MIKLNRVQMVQRLNNWLLKMEAKGYKFVEDAESDKIYTIEDSISEEETAQLEYSSIVYDLGTYEESDFAVAVWNTIKKLGSIIEEDTKLGCARKESSTDGKATLFAKDLTNK
jgi:hypothetical protein